MLCDGRGVAFEVFPAQGVLEPWGVLLVTVTLFNNMSGTFADELECCVETVPVARLALRATVAGCPLALAPECAGLDLSDRCKPLLNLGEIVVGEDESKGLTRTIRVRNSGPVDAELTWRQSEDDGCDDDTGEERLVDVLLRVNTTTQGDQNPVRVDVKWRERVEYDPPFTVSPQKARVPAQGEAVFTVALPASAAQPDSKHHSSSRATLGILRSLLVADARWDFTTLSPTIQGGSDDEHSHASLQSSKSTLLRASHKASALAGLTSPGARSATSAASANSANSVKSFQEKALLQKPVLAAVKLRLRGSLVTPRLQLEKQPGADGVATLRFKTWSTIAQRFSRAVDKASRSSRSSSSRGSIAVLDETETAAAAAAAAAACAGSSGNNDALQAADLVATVSTLSRLSPAASSRLQETAHATLRKSLVLKNPADVQLNVAALFVEPPFALLSATATNFRLDRAEMELAETAAADTSSAVSTKKKRRPLLTLLPRQSMTLELMFAPVTPSHVASALEPARLKHEHTGALRVVFDTGQTQRVVLRGLVLRPALAATPPAHSFGCSRVGEQVQLTVFVSNPTEVDAEWQLSHVPRSARVAEGIDGDAPQPGAIDDPAVFGWSCASGSQPGPSLALTSAAGCLPKDLNRKTDALFAQSLTALDTTVTTLTAALQKATDHDPRVPRPITVTFRPTRNKKYCARFRFHVECGESFDVVLQGEGTYEEDTLQPTQRVAANVK